MFWPLLIGIDFLMTHPKLPHTRCPAFSCNKQGRSTDPGEIRPAADLNGVIQESEAGVPKVRAVSGNACGRRRTCACRAVARRSVLYKAAHDFSSG